MVAPFDVRQSGFTGGGINAITKSGTNTFSGSAYTYYNNQDFYGKNSDAGIKLAKQSTQIYGVSLGGPIVRDKLFFFVNGEFNYDSSPSSFYPGYPGSRITVEDAETISNRYEELTGYDGGGYSHRNVVKRNGSDRCVTLAHAKENSTYCSIPCRRRRGCHRSNCRPGLSQGTRSKHLHRQPRGGSRLARHANCASRKG